MVLCGVVWLLFVVVCGGGGSFKRFFQHRVYVRINGELIGTVLVSSRLGVKLQTTPAPPALDDQQLLAIKSSKDSTKKKTRKKSHMQRSETGSRRRAKKLDKQVVQSALYQNCEGPLARMCVFLASQKATAHLSVLSCRPCLSHVPEKDQRLLRSPLSKQKNPSSPDVALHEFFNSTTERRPHSPEPPLPQSNKKKPVAPPCRSPRNLRLQVIHAAVCEMRTATTP